METKLELCECEKSINFCFELGLPLAVGWIMIELQHTIHSESDDDHVDVLPLAWKIWIRGGAFPSDELDSTVFWWEMQTIINQMLNESCSTNICINIDRKVSRASAHQVKIPSNCLNKDKCSIDATINNSHSRKLCKQRATERRRHEWVTTQCEKWILILQKQNRSFNYSWVLVVRRSANAWAHIPSLIRGYACTTTHSCRAHLASSTAKSRQSSRVVAYYANMFLNAALVKWMRSTRLSDRVDFMGRFFRFLRSEIVIKARIKLCWCVNSLTVRIILSFTVTNCSYLFLCNRCAKRAHFYME